MQINTLTPFATDEYFEYWLHAGEIYRNAIGNRGPIGADIADMPMGVRWECSLAHFKHFYGSRVRFASEVN